MTALEDYIKQLKTHSFRSIHDPEFSLPAKQWRINQLELALAFYADEKNWDAGPRGSFEDTAVFNDYGEVAKRALNKK